MPDLPASVHICEVGARDGLQIEPAALPVDDRVRMIESLLDAGIKEIEVGSFVNPKAVPQMADTDQVFARLRRRDGVIYRALALNPRGLQAAIDTGRADVEGRVAVTASETFTRRNTNRGTDDTFAEMPQWIDMYRNAGIDVTMFGVGAAFGCNFEGYIAQDRVIGLIERGERVMNENGCEMRHLTLADTMGWANPLQVKRMIGAIREQWPDLAIKLHLHDTRGCAIANAAAAMELGVREFDSAVGGLGGCPFAGHKGAAGNACTEDLVFLCEEMGIETGIDLDRLRDAALLVEELVGHPVPGKVMKGGTLSRFKTAPAHATA